jgi:hypothetical protein
MRLRSSLCYTQAHCLLAPFQARRLHLQSAHLLRALLTLPIASSSFRTRWATQLPANGDWCTSGSPTALPFPDRAYKMNVSSWNFILYITPTFGTRHPTSGTGCSIIPSATSPHQLLQRLLTSFDLLILPKLTPHAIDSCFFVIGSICFIAALLFTALSNSQVSMNGKHATAYPLLIGTS